MFRNVSDIFEDIFGEIRKHDESDGQIAFDCKRCSSEKGVTDGKGNLEINYNKNVFKCWSCGETHNMQGKVPYLLKRFGNKLHLRDWFLLKPDTDYLNKEKKEKIQISLPSEFIPLSNHLNQFKAKEALNYLYERGIDDELIKEFNIGYCYKGKYYNRIIIPSYDEIGKLNYFIGRWFPKEKNKLKYLNPDVDKQDIVFSYQKLNLDSTIYLVEGVFDHLVVPNSIPLLGKVVSSNLLNILHEKTSQNIVILLDGDAKKDTINIYNTLNFGDLRGRLKVCVPENDLDPSKINQDLGRKGIINLLRTSRTNINNIL